MKHSMKTIRANIPWLLLLFCIDAFATLLLWIADVQAFYAMTAVIVLATVLLFSLVCFLIVHRERKKEQAFHAFLYNPDEYHEELLLEIVSVAERESIRLLGKTLRDKQLAYAELETQLMDYEEYVESWAHETKTPLSLLTFLMDNRRNELPPSVSFKLDYIRNRMQESISQMLFYARLKSARKDYLFEHIPLRACIEDLLEDYGPLLEEKQFQIQLNLSSDVVYSDRRALYFLLGQMISNSIKYCSKDPELCFSALQRDDAYVLSIKDNGIGVRSCDLPYIFEKGFTGDSGEGRKKATGMGLYLAKETAKELNVTLNVHSEWGQGFEIQISFPIVKTEN
ncbi:MAG: HAMP domain-containing histidine kinase [Lachnospiraceae bacterium]|nr:HAMP domain-containing histidine kinase [Lachnospiraceae bacterium]